MRAVGRSTTWGVVIFQHLVYLFMLHGRSARAVAAAGLVSAALLAATRRVRFRFEWAPWAVIAAFLLPVASLFAVPQIAIVTLDGRMWLLIAWLFAVTMVVLASEERPLERSLPIILAVIWSSLFWLAIVSGTGVAKYAVSTDRRMYGGCRSDQLAVAFNIWETRPASEHLFLGWQTDASFANHQPYANHVQPYLFTMYAWTWLVRQVGRVPLYVSTNTVPVFYMMVLVASVFMFLRRAGLLPDAPSLIQLAAVFTACALLVTMWRFWNDLLGFNTDDPYPLLAGVLIFTAAALIKPVHRRLLMASAVAFVAFSPIHTPMLVVALACLFWPSGGRPGAPDARLLATVAIVTVFVGVAVYLLPWSLIKWKGYTPQGSSLLFRSGLDGDTRYFTNMIQAVIAPCPTGCCWSRPWWDLLFPAFVPLAGFAWLRGRRGQSPLPLASLLLFLLAPYLFSVVLFPQSISIHPYLYDHMLIIPITVAAIVLMFEWISERDADGGRKLLVLILLAGAVVMSNLVGIAQSLARVPR